MSASDESQMSAERTRTNPASTRSRVETMSASIVQQKLLAYVATMFAVHIPWGQVIRQSLWPRLSWRPEYITMVVAIFGTTISPYLFFWQASQEVEELEAAPKAQAMIEAPNQARASFSRIKIDTMVGMGFSNLIAFSIILTTAVTLNLHGVTNIQTSAQAVTALRPIAGEFAFWLFSAGIIGTGMLTVPVLTGSAAYAVAGTFIQRRQKCRKAVQLDISRPGVYRQGGLILARRTGSWPSRLNGRYHCVR